MIWSPLNIEVFFDNSIVLVAGLHSRWARRREVDLAELAAAPWILLPPGTWLYSCVALGRDWLKADVLYAPPNVCFRG
jgi:hypothetical protein